MSELTPHELVAKFVRCQKYPTDVRGINDLADGLERAAQKSGITMHEIVDATLPLAQFCPTDAEFLTIARNIRDERDRDADTKRNKTSEWQRQYGKPASYEWKAEAAKIAAATKIHWKKDAEMLKLMRDKAAERHVPLRKMGHLEHIRLMVECQRIVGIEVTPQQEKECR